MYRMIIVTALGNYVVEMVPEKEEPTADELMKMFLETKADVESGCFMEGWTPTDGLSGAPGVFAIGKGLEILAYHVERRPEFDLPPINPNTVNTRRPLSIKFNYLGNEMTAKCMIWNFSARNTRKRSLIQILSARPMRLRYSSSTLTHW